MNRPYVDSIESVSAIFETIYRSDTWTLGSGPGSLPTANAPLIEFLQKFIQKNRIARFVDFGCGDWQFMSAVDLGNVNYLGVDVVESVLVENRSRHQRSNVSFARTPDDLADLPEGDLIRSRMCSSISRMRTLPKHFIRRGENFASSSLLTTVRQIPTAIIAKSNAVGFVRWTLLVHLSRYPVRPYLGIGTFARAGSTVALDSCGDLPSFCLAGLKARPNGYGERA